MAQIPSLTPPSAPAQYAKDLAVFECADRYRRETGELASKVNLARDASLVAVFDQDAEHANAVFAKLAENNGPSSGQLIAEDLLARELVKLRSGVDPGSPVPASMVLLPSNPAAYLAAVSALQAQLAILAGLSYTAQDV